MKSTVVDLVQHGHTIRMHRVHFFCFEEPDFRSSILFYVVPLTTCADTLPCEGHRPGNLSVVLHSLGQVSLYPTRPVECMIISISDGID